MIATLGIAVLALATQDAKAGWTPAESMNVKTVADVQPSPDGRRAVFTVTTPVMTADKSEMLTQVWVATVDGADGRAFTSGEKSNMNPQWAPDGKWILFLSKR